MPIGLDLDSLFTVGTSVVSGALGGGIWQSFIGDYLKRKEADRAENKEAKALCLKILPLLVEIEHKYRVEAAENLYLWNIKDDIHDDIVPNVKIRPLDKKIAQDLDDAKLHMLEGEIAIRISLIEREITAINAELDSVQSSSYYSYDHPGNIAIAAKNHADIKLTAFLLQLNDLRKRMMTTYIGKRSWSSKEKRGHKQLVAMNKKARAHKSLTYKMRLKLANLKRKLYMKLALWRAR
ncbi:hypothetical protein PMNALOAF_2736 [Methylobacterium adhaesivum]|uniref:RPW8 domain-containing protein n=1 Tax=Methylobacterium adhaesivum TaxID=333297 RepID=A0ABT8BK89_9HYPH|nr:hypothetical protein [Methylobacterium adhaesivum]MDN3592090.1 hypothetical protein [Methylobacterium adhaesivum]GJD31477.1 hypothetical protein PMNALOAF_2736 [Methylobacterium adhaesivum]